MSESAAATDPSARTPVRVLQVASSAAGGVRRHVREVAAGLAATDRVILAAPADVVRPWVRGVRSTVLDIGDRPRATDAAVVSRLRTLGRRADVVHAHGLRAGGLAALALAGLPTSLVVTLHNLPVGGPTVQALAAGLERLVVRRAAVVLGVSTDIVDHMRGLGAREVERALVPAPAPAPVPALDRSTLGLEPGDRLVVTVARLAPQKGLDLLLRSAADLATRVQGVRWVVAGEGPLHAELSRAIDADGLPVQLLGPRDDVPALLAAADAVVSTAEWEGQPLWLQEALAAGAPIVATDVGGTREVTGAAARLVPPRSAEALSSQVAAVLRNREAADGLRAAARRRAEELPRTPDVLEQLDRTYRAAMLG